MIKEFERSFCVMLIILLFASTLILYLGFAALSVPDNNESVPASAKASCDSSTLTLDNIGAQAYDPVKNAERQNEIERIARENGCIVVLSQDTGDQTADCASVKSDLRSRYYSLPLNDGQQDAVFALCEQYDVPAELVLGIYLADAERYDGEDTGHRVMYPNPESAEWYLSEYGISDTDRFEGNMALAVIMIAEYYHRYPDVHMIAVCYELGEKQAIELKASGISETDYSRLVALKINTLQIRDHK